MLRQLTPVKNPKSNALTDARQVFRGSRNNYKHVDLDDV